MLRAAVLSAPLVLLAACGGGGGGGSSADNGGGLNTPAVTQVAITSTNAQPVAAEALASTRAEDAAQLGSELITGVQVSAGPAGASPMLLAAAARKLAAKAPAGAALATGVTTTETGNCTSGGTATFTVTESGASAAVAGDSVQISASNCQEVIDGQAFVMNGTFTVSVVSGSYDPDSSVFPKSVTLRIAANNFSMASAGDSVAFSGDMTLALTETGFSTGSITITSSALTTSIGTSAGTHTVSLANYSAQVTAGSNGSTSSSVSGTVTTNNSRIASGSVSYTITTLSPMVTSSTGVLTAGSMKVSGANNTSLVLTVTSPNAFSLQVDADGNGSYESTSNVTRSQLQALL